MFDGGMVFKEIKQNVDTMEKTINNSDGVEVNLDEVANRFEEIFSDDLQENSETESVGVGDAVEKWKDTESSTMKEQVKSGVVIEKVFEEIFSDDFEIISGEVSVEKGKVTDGNTEGLDSEADDHYNEYVEYDEQQIDNAENKPEHIKCRNENSAGEKHPETGVLFVRKVVKVGDKLYEVVVPEFESVYDAQLLEDMYEASDRDQFKECNLQLKNAVETNPELRKQFDEEQLEQIANGETPDGYTWHHDAEVGKMQLVDTETHQKTGHTGGRSIWGGGAENR